MTEYTLHENHMHFNVWCALIRNCCSILDPGLNYVELATKGMISKSQNLSHSWIVWSRYKQNICQIFIAFQFCIISPCDHEVVVYLDIYLWTRTVAVAMTTDGQTKNFTSCARMSNKNILQLSEHISCDLSLSCSRPCNLIRSSKIINRADESAQFVALLGHSKQFESHWFWPFGGAHTLPVHCITCSKA